MDEINNLEVAESKLPAKVGAVIGEATNVLTVREAVWPERRWSTEEGRFVRYATLVGSFEWPPAWR